MIKVKSDDKFAAKVLDMLGDAYAAEERPEDGKWHVSHLIFPRQTVARELKYPGYKTTRQDIGFFFMGKAMHAEVQRIMGVGHSEKKGEKHGVVATMDYLKKGKDELAMEIKSSRKWTLPDEPEGHYVKQAGYYAVIHDLERVTILVIYPTAGRTWKGKKASSVEARAWVVETPKKVREQIKYDMLRTVEELEKAIKTKNVKGLPPAPDWTVERYGKKMPSGGYDFDAAKEHPFPFAWKEKRWL